jgi:hypothetical protein
VNRRRAEVGRQPLREAVVALGVLDHNRPLLLQHRPRGGKVVERSLRPPARELTETLVVRLVPGEERYGLGRGIEDQH